MAMSSSQSRKLNSVFQKLRSGTSSSSIFLLDGGTGEELFRRGVPDDRKIWSATAVVHDMHHSVLQDVHQSFVDAGAQAITTNSYGITPGVGFSPEQVESYCALAGKLCRQVADRNKDVLVFGSLGPLVESYRPDLIMEHEKGVANYRIAANSLAASVDAFLAETMSCVEESMQAIEAVGQLGSGHPMLVSHTLDTKGCLRNHEPTDQALERLIDFARKHEVEILAFLFNCAEPESISKALEIVRCNTRLSRMLKENGILLGAYANRLTPVAEDWTLEASESAQPMRGDLDPHRYCQEFARTWATKFGVTIIGGCCGISPNYIKELYTEFHANRI